MDRSSLLVLTYALKAKDSVGQSIQSVVTADAYVKAGVNACALESRPFLVDPIPFLWAKN